MDANVSEQKKVSVYLYLFTHPVFFFSTKGHLTRGCLVRAVDGNVCENTDAYKISITLLLLYKLKTKPILII